MISPNQSKAFDDLPLKDNLDKRTKGHSEQVYSIDSLREDRLQQVFEEEASLPQIPPPPLTFNMSINPSTSEILAGRYEIIKQIGRGGFGQTFLAKDTHLPRNALCVVKKLQPQFKNLALLNIAKRLFRTEAENLQKLGSHDQIPQLLAYFEEEQEFYLVQQYIEGHTLNKEMKSGKPWSEEDVIELLQDCLSILDYIHSQGVIHRDIKPTNLIRRQQDNKLVLIDFGSVKEIIFAQSQIVVNSTIAVGTSGYMPIEQVKGKPHFSSDIYALGIIGTQALTGVNLKKFQENELGEIIWPNPANANRGLAKILSKMVRFHLKDRYKSAKEVLEALEPLRRNTSKTSSKRFGQNDSSGFEKTIYLTQAKQNPQNKIKLGIMLGCAALIGVGATTGLYLKNQTVDKAVAEIELKRDQKQYQECIETASSEINKPEGKAQSIIGKILDECRVEYAKQQAESSELESAIATALQISNNSSTYPESKQLIEDWSQKILDLAQEKSNSSKLGEAISIAVKMPKDSSKYQESQQLIHKWSEQLLEQAREKYERLGKLNEAIEAIALIPADTSVKQEAEELSKQWQEEHQTCQPLLANAQIVLNRNQWQDAKNKAEQIQENCNSTYWKQQANPIISKANQILINVAAIKTQRATRTPSIIKIERPPIQTPSTKIERPIQTKQEPLNLCESASDIVNCN